jgi:hypothetical protein
MTDALVEINDRLAKAAASKGAVAVTFFCECGECLAEDVALSLDEHEEIRARDDLIFAPGHDAPRRYRRPERTSLLPRGSSGDWPTLFDSGEWRGPLTRSAMRAAGDRS